MAHTSTILTRQIAALGGLEFRYRLVLATIHDELQNQERRENACFERLYSGTKAALRAFVRTWTMELKNRGIRSNVLSPGATETPILEDLFGSKEAAEAGKAQLAATPLGRIGRPEEIAAAALFLASSEASFVAGIDLAVDGGLSAV